MAKIRWVVFILILLLLSCSQASEENPQVLQDSSQSSTGKLVVFLTDLPAGVEKVLVTISAIDVHKTGGASFTVFSGEREYDLLELQKNPELLFDTSLEEGKYTQIRLQVTAGQIQVSGVLYPLTIPSSQVKINCNFSVLSGGTTRIILDFDAEKSLQVSGNPKNNKYNLRPVIKIKSISY
ncbi:MAG: DUF4382 domain-containing protein [Candidatus Aminicenantes bacterium]|nr:DUF4382 domain-containing protein [Candidatus Aminicenantes bacterium]